MDGHSMDGHDRSRTAPALVHVGVAGDPARHLAHHVHDGRLSARRASTGTSPLSGPIRRSARIGSPSRPHVTDTDVRGSLRGAVLGREIEAMRIVIDVEETRRHWAVRTPPASASPHRRRRSAARRCSAELLARAKNSARRAPARHSSAAVLPGHLGGARRPELVPSRGGRQARAPATARKRKSSSRKKRRR